MDPHAQHMHMAMTSIRWFAEFSIEGSITQEIERFVLEHRAKRYLHARISRASIAIRRLVELALKVKG